MTLNLSNFNLNNTFAVTDFNNVIRNVTVGSQPSQSENETVLAPNTTYTDAYGNTVRTDSYGNVTYVNSYGNETSLTPLTTQTQINATKNDLKNDKLEKKRALAELAQFRLQYADFYQKQTEIKALIEAANKEMEALNQRAEELRSILEEKQEFYSEKDSVLLGLIKKMADETAAASDESMKLIKEREKEAIRLKDEVTRLVEKGELTPEEAPAYIAGRLGGTDKAAAIASAKGSIADSLNGQIVSIVASMNGMRQSMDGYINQLNSIINKMNIVEDRRNGLVKGLQEKQVALNSCDDKILALGTKVKDLNNSIGYNEALIKVSVPETSRELELTEIDEDVNAQAQAEGILDANMVEFDQNINDVIMAAAIEDIEAGLVEKLDIDVVPNTGAEFVNFIEKMREELKSNLTGTVNITRNALDTVKNEATNISGNIFAGRVRSEEKAQQKERNAADEENKEKEMIKWNDSLKGINVSRLDYDWKKSKSNPELYLETERKDNPFAK